MNTVRASLASQMVPTRISHCDPGPGLGYRIAFYGDDGSWSQIDTSFPVMTADEGRALTASANQAASDLRRIAA